jgi:hypothetical protein
MVGPRRHCVRSATPASGCPVSPVRYGGGIPISRRQWSLLMHMRSFFSALVMFIGVTGTMIPLGAMIFEESSHTAMFAAGATGGAGWLAVGTYRSSRPDTERR